MAKNYRLMKHPQMWYNVQENNLVEIVFRSDFGHGDEWYRFWVPFKREYATPGGWHDMKRAAIKRLEKDYKVSVDYCSGLFGHKHPLSDILEQK